MTASWTPLPFPACPNCRKSWVTCYHRQCHASREIVVEPHSRQARCPNCNQQWSVSHTAFHCQCGHVFHASDVEQALSTVALIKARLIQQVEAMDQAEK